MASPTGAFVPGVQVARARHAEGPLSGLTFAVKDLFAVRGHRSSAGVPEFAQQQQPATADANVIATLLSAGADLLGVTVLDEFAFSLTGQNPHYGTPVNPRAPGRLCGGSSCGSAAAVAACLCDFALGTDTGGSVRVPAAFCGLFGLRPSHAAISSEGLVPLAPSFDTVGFFAREPRTFERVAEVLLGAPSTEPVRAILVADDAFELCDAGVAELLTHLLERAASQLSVPLQHLKLLPDGFAPLRRAYARLQGREAHAAHGRFVAESKPQLSPAIAKRFEIARHYAESEEGFEEDSALRRRLRQQLSELLTPQTLLFLPPAPGTAPRLDASDDALDRFRGAAISLTALGSLTGLPQLVVPARELEGAPLGLSFMAASGADAWLCGLANTFDHAVRA
ncbi:MAG TPA: amidase [Polyangiales bacterium]